MATVITEECINCGACEPECPNTAIYQGGVDFDDLAGAKQTALSAEFFYIVPEKCTECVGFFDQEACAAVCPVDCCVPDPARPETEAALLIRAKEIHPDQEFGEDFPSRFKEAQATADSAPAGAGAPAAGAPAASAPGAVAPGAAAPGAGGGAPAPRVGTGGRVERALRAPQPVLDCGDPTLDFAGELERPFDELMDEIVEPSTSGGSVLVGLGLLAAAPGLGALGHDARRSIEDAFGDRRFFSSEMAAGINMLQNFVLYPVLAFAFGTLTGRMTPYTEGDRLFIVVGLLAAICESAVRLREGFRGVPVHKMRIGASAYGWPLSLVLSPILKRFVKDTQSGHVPVEGFYTNEFEPKRERERRYGEVYEIQEFDRGYYIRFDLPRFVPSSGAKDELGIGDEMPEYDVDVRMENGTLTVAGSVVDEQLRTLCGVSSAFPADFTTQLPLSDEVGGFRHRYGDKTLEIVALKRAA